MTATIPQQQPSKIDSLRQQIKEARAELRNVSASGSSSWADETALKAKISDLQRLVKIEQATR